jgi:hypothetical protein
VAVCMVAIGVIPLVAHRILMPWWDQAADIREMVDNQHDGIGNEGADEYAPAGVDPYNIDQKAPRAKFQGVDSAKVTVENWAAEKRVAIADAAAPGNLALRMFNYPLWHVKVNGRAAQTATGSHGEILVPVPPGKSRVEINFVEGWDRRVGAVTSFLTLLVTFIWHIRQKEHGIRAESKEPTAESRPS